MRADHRCDSEKVARLADSSPRRCAPITTWLYLHSGRCVDCVAMPLNRSHTLQKSGTMKTLDLNVILFSAAVLPSASSLVPQRHAAARLAPTRKADTITSTRPAKLKIEASYTSTPFIEPTERRTGGASPIYALQRQKILNVPVSELLGEAGGTCGMVGIGSYASMTAAFTESSTVTLPDSALVWSMAAVASMILTKPLSPGGAHMNPAMTIAFATFRGLDWNRVGPYCLAQVLGSAAGSAITFWAKANTIADFEAAKGLDRAKSIPSARVFGEYYDDAVLSTAQAFAVEAFGTACLAAVVFALTHPQVVGSTTGKQQSMNIPAPPLIGGTIFSLICSLAPYTQCGMNRIPHGILVRVWLHIRPGGRMWRFCTAGLTFLGRSLVLWRVLHLLSSCSRQG